MFHEHHSRFSKIGDVFELQNDVLLAKLCIHYAYIWPERCMRILHSKQLLRLFDETKKHGNCRFVNVLVKDIKQPAALANGEGQKRLCIF